MRQGLATTEYTLAVTGGGVRKEKEAAQLLYRVNQP